MFKGQAEQDKFILNVLKRKTNGVFVEIGPHMKNLSIFQI